MSWVLSWSVEGVPAAAQEHLVRLESEAPNMDYVPTAVIGAGREGPLTVEKLCIYARL